MEKQIALFMGVIGSFVSYLVDGIGLASTVLLGMMAIDYVTGLIAAAYNHKLHSRTGFRGLLRKCYYLLALSAVYLMGYAVPELRFAGDGLAVALIAMEFISITENGTKINAPMPKMMKRFLLIVNEKINGKEEEQNGK